MKKKSRAEVFFCAEDRSRIKEATRAAESLTSGEIAVMVVDSSDQYREAEVIGGMMLAGLLSLLVTEGYFHASVLYFIPMSLLLFFPARFIFMKIPSLKMALTGNMRMAEAVRLMALRAFYDKGLYKTRDNTGVLFFISLLEKKVWVLADKGIYEKIDQEGLNRLSAKVAKGIKEGRACEALSNAIAEAGELLAKHFPVKPDDTNELSDEVMTE